MTRSCAGTISLSILLLGIFPVQTATFPIPSNMHETWPGAKLNDADKQLLQQAVDADFRKLSEEADPGKNFEGAKFQSADISLGTLGSGVIVSISDPVICGTGGCPIYAYLREKSAYRTVLSGEHGMGSLGWAFAVVKSKSGIPDIVIASNSGGGLMGLTRYRYSGHAFKTNACEILTKKAPESDQSWWDPSAVNIQPCSRNRAR
jgi:hypothetical protein